MDNKQKKSIKTTIILVAITTMLLSMGGIGYLVFSRWFNSAKQESGRVAQKISDDIQNQIQTFMQVPMHINEVSYKYVEHDFFDLSDENIRDEFFVAVLDSHEDWIYSFTYSTDEGKHYGAYRNKKGLIEVTKNYGVTGEFDPRTRAWYRAAAQSGKPGFAPIYENPVMKDLAISAGWPIYNKAGKLRGVLGAHILLGDIGEYLAETVDKYNGYAIIFEKSSGVLIANSMGTKNFDIDEDGTLNRYGIDKLDIYDFYEAYIEYLDHPKENYFFESKENKLFMNVRELKGDSLEWIVISAIPRSAFVTPVIKNLKLTILWAGFALVISLVLYLLIARKLLRPLGDLLKVSGEFALGNMGGRIRIVRYDEIGRISKSFNNVADKMQYLISNLEDTVQERTEELHRANTDLENSKDQLQLILDSAGEGIFGMNPKGECTFCNISCIKLLGYNSPEDLIGRNMHAQIHHTTEKGKPIPIDECKVIKAVREGRGIKSSDEVFWRADGTYFHVEYRSYPQMKENQVVGGVVTFTDITHRREKETEIHYLSFHDPLTGLHNRSYLENKRAEIDITVNLPLSIIYADVNELKLTNDIFGHAMGDKLIKETARILANCCRGDDFIVRMGGDEFLILLPKTSKSNAERILARIHSEFKISHLEGIKFSVSLGMDTKTDIEQSLEKVIANAESAMYWDKTINRPEINADIIDSIMETLHSRNSNERQHAQRVSELCGKMGLSLGLSQLEINKLKRAGYLHDIGKIVMDKDLLIKQDLTGVESEEAEQHAVVGYRILNLFDDTLDLAEYIYSHHENWDGSGYPRGLMGEQIPLIARIISVVEVYDRALGRGMSNKEALEYIECGAGKRFDPWIVELFIEMMGN